VSALSKESVSPLLQRLWRDPAAWSTTSDIFAILVAASLPWSTTLVAIFACAFLVSIVPFLDLKAFLNWLRQPVSVLPIALFVLAIVGTLWSDASWGDRLYAIGPASKLLMIPVLLYHFARSTRGVQVLIAFLVSCALLMVMSWVVAFDPRFALRPDAGYGVPVKNYIDQSQEFSLCAVVLAYPIIMLWRARKFRLAILLAAVSVSFVVNMLFVNVSRTALVTMPVMLVVFAIVHLRWRSIALIACASAVLGGLAWTASPKLRVTTERLLSEYSERKDPSVTRLRMVFWEKSLRFISDAPIFGHGTGSIRGQFERDAIGKSGAVAEVIANPHNQTLHVGIQWGALGVVVLYAMWVVHLLLFRGSHLAAWIGLMVVLQNFFSSMFNSHLFDFNPGWMYVLGVGIAGGMLAGNRTREIAGRGNPLESAGWRRPVR
jgi:O-antigen ligase